MLGTRTVLSILFIHYCATLLVVVLDFESHSQLLSIFIRPPCDMRRINSCSSKRFTSRKELKSVVTDEAPNESNKAAK